MTLDEYARKGTQHLCNVSGSVILNRDEVKILVESNGNKLVHLKMYGYTYLVPFWDKEQVLWVMDDSTGLPRAKSVFRLGNDCDPDFYYMSQGHLMEIYHKFGDRWWEEAIKDGHIPYYSERGYPGIHWKLKKKQNEKK